MTPENDPLVPDEFERLEQQHQRMKEAHEAWRKMLKSLAKFEPEQTDKPDPEKPNAS